MGFFEYWFIFSLEGEEVYVEWVIIFYCGFFGMVWVGGKGVWYILEDLGELVLFEVFFGSIFN